MGYFGQQIYNEPMSMYVDPKLDILANSLGAVQKRHDENYAAMSALDIMANNTQVADGDRDIKDAALGRLKQQRDAIASSGDYAYATPRIGLAVRDWSADQNLNMAKENMTAIKEAEKTRQAMQAAGHSVLDFNPAEGWKTVGADGKARRFVAQNEKELDYDTRAQEVSKLIASTRNLGLTPANIRDFLQSGSITGISDQRVKDNLEGSIMRFMNSPEGDQMKRKLTKIKGMGEGEADDYISNYLFNVGKAQTFTKEDVNYQVNAPAVQRENREDQQAFDLQRDAINHRQALELQRQKIAADAIEEDKKLAKAATVKEKAEKIAKKEAVALAPHALWDRAASLTDENGNYGTVSNDETFSGIHFPKVTVEDPETKNKYDAMRVPMEIGTMGSTFVPEAAGFNEEQVKIAKEYYKKESDVNTIKEKLLNLEEPSAISKTLGTAFPVIGKAVDIAQGTFGEDKERKKFLLEKDLEKAQAELKKLPAEHANIAAKYKTAFEGDNLKAYEAIGKKFNGKVVDANVNMKNPTNTYRVNGKKYGEFTTKMKGTELSDMSASDLEWAKTHNLITGLGPDDKIEENKYYNVNFVSKIPESATIAEDFDKKKMGTTDVAANHAEYVTQNAENQRNMANLGYKMKGLIGNAPVPVDPTNPKSKQVPFRERTKVLLQKQLDKQVKDYMDELNTKVKDEKERQLYIQNDLTPRLNTAKEKIKEVDRFSSMTDREREAFILYLQENNV